MNLHPFKALALSATLACIAGTATPAQALTCSNDGRPSPRALLERFMDADCSTCWQDPASAAAPAQALALDWVRPAAQGDEAAMSAVALPEAQARLAALGLAEGPSVQRLSRLHAQHRLRVVQGFAMGGHLGAKLTYRPQSAQPYTAWLLLVEQLPAGEEGSPVARQLVRAAVELRPGTRQGRPQGLDEIRAFALPETARPERLRVLGWVQDAQGRLLALAQTHCADAP